MSEPRAIDKSDRPCEPPILSSVRMEAAIPHWKARPSLGSRSRCLSVLTALVLAQAASAGPGVSSSQPLPTAAAEGEGDSPAPREEPKSRWVERFLDDKDGWFDVSNHLDKPFGFFPIVSPITEPAVGAGLAVVPVFIDRPEDRSGRPNVYAAGAMRTSNGTEGLFGGYSGYWLDQRLHVLAGGINASINLDFHGLGNESGIGAHPLRYNLDSTGGILGLEWSLAEDSPWRLGMRYAFAEIGASFNRSRDQERFDLLNTDGRFGLSPLESTISSLRASVLYDTRNNIFTPTEGLFSEVSVTVNDEALGGSDNYQILSLTGLYYRPLLEDTLFLGVRGDGIQSFGDVPFYRRPAIRLRGVPAQRFQGEGVAFAEMELRWQFSDRFSAVGFGGAGVAWAEDSPLSKTLATGAGGGGFRYLIARRFGLHAGIDVAYGEEGPALYIQFGSAWARP